MTIPDEGSTDATPGVPLLQVPPEVEHAKVVVDPTQTLGVPVIPGL